MSVNLWKLFNPVYNNYQYDQLNRIVAMDQYGVLNNVSNQWTPVLREDYKERVSYDANGNILKYLRQGTDDWRGKDMDSLSYKYYAGTNKLNYVKDAIGATPYYDDIESQNLNNYTYDLIGNLKSDVKEGLSNVNWTVYGKIKAITKTGTNIAYGYDPGGNRTYKTVTTGGTTTQTFYIRDAQGNTLAVYSKVGTATLKWNEQQLYGSSRLGIFYYEDVVPATAPVVQSNNQPVYDSFTVGKRIYELSNHLGNVLTTISDKKIGITWNGSTVAYYTPEVISHSDYYPFGMLQTGRSYSVGSNYRYGFNGKENDNEVKGNGNQQDYGMRIYDTRVGRFLSVDPLAMEYPWNSTYGYAENDVIRSKDLDGEERVQTTIFNEPGNGKPGLAVITINLTFKVVTSGFGAINGKKLNPAEFSKRYSDGATSLSLSTLPNQNTQATEASAPDIASGNYYTTYVFYNYTLIVNPNTTLIASLKWVLEDEVSRGIVWNEMNTEDQKALTQGIVAEVIFGKQGLDFLSISRDLLGFNRFARDMVFPNDPDVRAAGSNESILRSPRNLVVTRAEDPGGPGEQSKTEVLVHEGGHPSAKSHVHSNSKYTHKNDGLSSNERGKTTPTKYNTLEIINDHTNRQNSQTLQFDNTKLNTVILRK